MDAVTLTLRPAEADDFNEIVKLSEGIYAGHDYLPLTFHHWLQRDNIVVILAHCGVRLVGLVAYFVVDDGRTLIHRAGRVHPDYRGQGIFKHVGEYSVEHAKEHYPSLQRKRFVSIRDTEIPEPGKLLEMHTEAYHVGKEFCEKPMATALTNSMKIKTCTPDYFADIIESLPARLFEGTLFSSVTGAHLRDFDPMLITFYEKVLKSMWRNVMTTLFLILLVLARFPRE